MNNRQESDGHSRGHPWLLSLAALLGAAIFLAGCASETPNVVSADNDPADPGAPSGKMSGMGMAKDSPQGQPQSAPMPGSPHPSSGAEEGGGMAMPIGNDASSAPGAMEGMDMGTTPSAAKTSVGDAPRGGKPVYTCPMHPDVISDRPGICPKCGMTLIKKTQVGGSPESQ